MSLIESLFSRVARPAGKALDPTIRDLVQQVLKEHGYASPAEVQALRDEVRDMRSRVDGMAKRLDEITRTAEAAREAARAVKPADSSALEARIAELEGEVRRLSVPAPVVAAAPAPAPLVADEPEHHCKVGGCDGAVRSKGFCSPHYQQWRRGTLPGFVGLDGHVTVGTASYRVKSTLAGGLAEVRDGAVFVDGRAV